MAVFFDGTNNYLIGNNLNGVVSSELQSDLANAFTGIGLTYGSYGNRTFSFRPFYDTLTGTLSAPTAVIGTTSNITNQSRFSIDTLTYSTTGNAVLFLLNSSTNDTEITIRGADTGIIHSSWVTNVTSNSQNWAVLTNKSISFFTYKDANNYLFNSVGVVNNVGSVIAFPQSIYGMYSGKHLGTKIKSFRGITPNSTTPIEFLSSGALNTQAASANYPHLVASGTSGNVSQFGLRRSDNDYMIGTVPNIMKMKGSLSYNIGDNIQLNNLNNANTALIDGSTENIFKVVTRLDSTTTNDDLGDYLLMRIKKA